MWIANSELEMSRVWESWEWVWSKRIDYEKWVIEMISFYLDESILFWGMHMSKEEIKYKSVFFEWFWVNLQKIRFCKKINKPI